MHHTSCEFSGKRLFRVNRASSPLPFVHTAMTGERRQCMVEQRTPVAIGIKISYGSRSKENIRTTVSEWNIQRRIRRPEEYKRLTATGRQGQYINLCYRPQAANRPFTKPTFMSCSVGLFGLNQASSCIHVAVSTETDLTETDLCRELIQEFCFIL